MELSQIAYDRYLQAGKDYQAIVTKGGDGSKEYAIELRKIQAFLSGATVSTEVAKKVGEDLSGLISE
ncbi:MAG: hypothetical protein HHAS10_02500 [Candidatus Altimarinota bacterium]